MWETESRGPRLNRPPSPPTQSYALSSLPGDNFYENGVDSVDDPLWNTRYCSVYTDPALLDVPWYAILGTSSILLPPSLPPSFPPSLAPFLPFFLSPFLLVMLP